MSGQHGTIPLHRIEAFSDAVFAFAVTLLAVSLEVPKSAHELVNTLRGTLAFGVCFALLGAVWLEHSRFFKRYPLGDGRTLVLNMLLLFTVLTYVYPMKFLFSTMLDLLVFHVHSGAVESSSDIRTILTIFGLGAFAINILFFLMHRHAAALADTLHLSDAARADLRASAVGNVLTCLIALCSIAIALIFNDAGAVSGPIYVLTAPARILSRRVVARRKALPA